MPPLLHLPANRHRRLSALAVLAASSLAVPAQPPTASRHHPPSRTTRSAVPSLSPHEQALHLLDRFTFGARPGEADRIAAEGTDAWLERQLHPDSIPDPVLASRLADYPAITLSPQQAIALFPDKGLLRQISNGKLPLPADPELAAVYQVEVLKYDRREAKKAGDEKTASSAALTPAAASPSVPSAPTAAPPAPSASLQPTFDETDPGDRRSHEREANQEVARLLELPRGQRFTTLLHLPVENRAVTATFVSGDQRAALLRDFNPHERELFQAMSSGPGNEQHLDSELAESTILRDILSERQLQAVMTDFWFNHFNVFIGKESDRWYTPSYVRDTIRPHALGHFHDLLLATATSPAMLVYLDNWLSVGPDSQAAGGPGAQAAGKPVTGNRKAGKGLNENYGRELMELHTLSVDGGYTQADVTALSSIFTGWTVERPPLGGPFQFDQRRHEPGDKQWLGHTIHEGRNPNGTPNGMKEGLEALDLLARSPHTARFISTLLAQRFVADDPPTALVDRLTATYLETDGDISAMLRAIVASPEFRSRPFFRNKVKTPVEFVASAFRSTGTDPTNPGVLVSTLRSMGMPLFGAQPPTGYILTADHWMNSAALLSRLTFADALTAGRLANQRFDSGALLADALLTSPAPYAPAPAAVSAPGPLTPASSRHDLRRDPTSGIAMASLTSLRSSAAAPQGRHETLAENSSTSAEGSLPPALPSPGGPPADTSKTSSDGVEAAVQLTANAVLETPLRPSTLRLVRSQLTAQQRTTPDTLNLLDRLLLSSPDFQLR